MQVVDKIAGNILFIKINGHITGIYEVSKIKAVIAENSDLKIIELDIKDAYVIPSMLIGFLIKEVNLENKKIRLKCSQKELKQLIVDLNLHTVFEIS